MTLLLLLAPEVFLGVFELHLEILYLHLFLLDYPLLVLQLRLLLLLHVVLLGDRVNLLLHPVDHPLLLVLELVLLQL